MRIAWHILGLLGALCLTAVASAQPAKVPPDAPPPKAAPAVQAVLDRADAAYQAERYAEAMRETLAALDIAQESDDLVGRALGLSLYAGILFYSGKSEESIQAWIFAGEAWNRCPPESRNTAAQVEAYGEATALLIRRERERAHTFLTYLLELVDQEDRRPRGVFGMLYRIGNRLGTAGAPAEEKRCLEKALSLSQRLFGEGIQSALCRWGLGDAEVALGNPRGGLKLYQAAIPVIEKQSPDSPATESKLYRLSALAYRLGEYGVAVEQWRKVARALENESGRELALAQVRHNLGNALRRVGRVEEGLTEHRKALAFFEKQPSNEALLADEMQEIGNDLRELGRPDEARSHYEQSLALRRKLAPESLDVAASLSNLAVVLMDFGDYAAALEYAGQAVAMERKFSATGESLATALTTRGNVHFELEDYRSAQRDYRESLTIREAFDPDSPQVAIVCNALSSAFAQAGDRVQAVSFALRAQKIAQEIAPGSLLQATCLENLGHLLWTSRDYEGALSRYRQALQLSEALNPQSPGVASTCESIALCLRGLRKTDEAERYAKRAWELVQAQEGIVSGDEGRQAFWKANAFRAATLLGIVIDRGRFDEALTLQEEARASSLRRLLVERNLNRTTVPPSVWKAFEGAQRESERAGEALSRGVGSSPEELSKLRRAAVLARVAMEDRWEKVRRSAPALFPMPIDVATGRRKLPPGALYVGYTMGEAEAYVLAASQSQAPRGFVIKTDIEALRKRLRKFRVEVVDPNTPPGDLAAEARKLYALLFPGELATLVRGARSLVLSPDGPLWDFPYAALCAPAPRGYLGLEKPLAYTQSLTLLTSAINRTPPTVANLRVLALGDPEFGRQGEPSPAATSSLQRALFSNGAIPQLPAARKEATAIARLYGTTPLMGADATEKAVRERIGAAQITHLATHGYLHPLRAMSSGLILARNSTLPSSVSPLPSSSDGDLQAWEIMRDLKLKSALVVLSACETGRGEKVPGEGLIGLTRALQYAGAKSVVASQWKVADKSTEQLMIAFHRALRAGKAKDEALRLAMVTVRKQPGTDAPYYWAPFVLVGDAGAIFKAPAPKR